MVPGLYTPFCIRIIPRQGQEGPKNGNVAITPFRKLEKGGKVGGNGAKWDIFFALIVAPDTAQFVLPPPPPILLIAQILNKSDPHAPFFVKWNVI